MTQTVVVTGVLGSRGRQVAQALVEMEGVRVLGLDNKPAGTPIAGVEHVQADIRNPLLKDLLTLEQVDTVVHLAFRAQQRRTEPVFESNVVGTMRLFGATAEAGVRKIVFPSTTMVYGAIANTSAFIPETAEFRGSPRYSFVRELREIESFINGFRRRVPEMIVTTLRFAHPLGLGATSPLARWLTLSMPPLPIGFDPRMQVIHTDDVVAALVHAVAVDAPGVFNVAADDEVLSLCQIVALVGKIPAPLLHPVLDWGLDATRALNPGLLSLLPLEPNYLRYACVGDTTRMREELGFAPQYLAREAVSAFAAGLRTRRYAGLQDMTEALRGQLQAVIELRQRLREQTSSGASPETPSGGDAQA